MKKKNIGFILFGVAGVEIISALTLMFVFPQLYERLGITTHYTNIIFRIVSITSLITVVILIVVGIILLIIFRNE